MSRCALLRGLGGLRGLLDQSGRFRKRFRGLRGRATCQNRLAVAISAAGTADSRWRVSMTAIVDGRSESTMSQRRYLPRVRGFVCVFTGIVEELRGSSARKTSAIPRDLSSRGRWSPPTPATATDRRQRGVSDGGRGSSDGQFSTDVMAETPIGRAWQRWRPEPGEFERAAAVNSRLWRAHRSGPCRRTGTVVSRAPSENWEVGG